MRWLEFLSVTPSLLQCPRSASVLRCHSQPLPERGNSEEVSHKTSHYLGINIPVVSWVDAPYAEHLLLCLKHVFILALGAPSHVSACTCVCASALFFCWTTAWARQRFQPCQLAELLSSVEHLHGSLQKRCDCALA